MNATFIEDGNTPLTPHELADLIPDHLSTRHDLNEWERENILRGREWAMRSTPGISDILSDSYVRTLHKRMFDRTWRWAGVYRTTQRNLGVPFAEIRERLMLLLGDVRHQAEHRTYPAQELAVRFHYRLVCIHPFPNGNGRQARLIADVLNAALAGPVLSWGKAELASRTAVRNRYIEAMRAADAGDITALLAFAAS